MSSQQRLHWQMRYHKERANGGTDRKGQCVVILTDQGRYFDCYFRDQAAADAYVAERGLEGKVLIFPVD